MDEAALLKEISVAIHKPKALALAQSIAVNEPLIPVLIKFTFHAQKETAFRAAWILETITELYPQAFEAHVPYFISGYAAQQHQGCRRHFATIMMDLTSNVKYREAISAADMEPIVEAAFEWLIDPLSAIAVQANCMDVLYNLKDRYYWIGDELREQVLFLMKRGGAAIHSRGKKILARLK